MDHRASVNGPEGAGQHPGRQQEWGCPSAHHSPRPPSLLGSQDGDAEAAAALCPPNRQGPDHRPGRGRQVSPTPMLLSPPHARLQVPQPSLCQCPQISKSLLPRRKPLLHRLPGLQRSPLLGLLRVRYEYELDIPATTRSLCKTKAHVLLLLLLHLHHHPTITVSMAIVSIIINRET